MKSIVLILMILSTNATAKDLRILEGEKAPITGVLVDDPSYKDLVFKERRYDDLEKRFQELQISSPMPCEETSVIDDILNDGLWFLLGASVGVLAMEVAR